MLLRKSHLRYNVIIRHAVQVESLRKYLRAQVARKVNISSAHQPLTKHVVEAKSKSRDRVELHAAASRSRRRHRRSSARRLESFYVGILFVDIEGV
jgi:hypothetical protein